MRKMSVFFVGAIFFLSLLFLWSKHRNNCQNKASHHSGIVSVAPNITEILYKLALENEISAVSSNCDYPERAKMKPNIGNYWQPDIESIIAIEPSLVLMLTNPRDIELSHQLNEFYIKSINLEMNSIKQFYASINNISAVTNRIEEGLLLVDDIKSKLGQINENLININSKRVLFVVQIEPIIMAVGRKTHINEILAIAKAENVIPNSMSDYPSISMEQLLELNPEVIIVPEDAGHNMTAENLAEKLKGFQEIDAVRNGNIITVDGNLSLRLSPRIVMAVSEIALKIHPELFTKEETN